MNRKQRQRRHARRRLHKQVTRAPRNVISRVSYPTVKQGHIVPRVYQANFAIGEQVSMHVDGRCVLTNIRNAGTRGPYYRRTRPDGSTIDDIETSLSFIEEAVRPVFDAVLGGAPLTVERKGTLAQFFGIQIVRGPAFFEQRTELVDRMLGDLTAAQIKPRALARTGGDVEAIRQQVRGAYLAKTHQFITMINTSFKIASVIGSMRWQLLRFPRPLLAYSDHPVVLWPFDVPASTPFTRQHLAPMSAIEIRVPLAPELALLMTWADHPDPLHPTPAHERFAGELNAFTIGQADRQWMHTPGPEPPIATGTLTPLHPAFESGYDPAAAAQSQRRVAAGRYLHRVRNKNHLSQIEIVDLRAT
jgi:hypothetical protein